MKSQAPLHARIWAWCDWQALIGVWTKNFPIDIKNKFVIHNYGLVLCLFYKQKTKRLCKPKTFGLAHTQQISSSPNFLVFASAFINTANRFPFLNVLTHCPSPLTMGYITYIYSELPHNGQHVFTTDLRRRSIKTSRRASSTGEN